MTTALALRRALLRRPVRPRGCAVTWRAYSIQDVSRDSADAASGARLDRQVEPKHLDAAATSRLTTQCLLAPAHNPHWQLIEEQHFQHLSAPPQWDAQLAELQRRMGVQFRDITHLKSALVHHGAIPQSQLPAHIATQRLSNRSLEFLGDSVLGMAVASHVFQSQPRFQEGQLTRLKAMLVNNETLSQVAVHDLRLHELILVASEFSVETPRDDASYHKGRTTIQAGALEALIAAVYVDQGLERALSFVNDVVLPSAIQYATEEHTFQPVVALQNLLQAHSYGHPTYRRVPAPSTSEVFQVELFVRDEYVLTGEGASYKEARVNAARAGYDHYSALLPHDNTN